jgi:trehalose-phosphatase
MLDFDGTLAPFRVDPAAVEPYAGVSGRIRDILAEGHTRVVLVTGRPLTDGFPFLGPGVAVETWGSHGRERRWPDGRYVVMPIAEAPLKALARADDCCDEITALGGRCEWKPGVLAVHWRGLSPDARAAVRDAVARTWQEEGLGAHLVWHEFDGGIELKAPGRDKGDVVAAVLAEEDPATPAAYLGDDRTDEDAFRSIAGRGLAVLVRDEHRPTAAPCWLRPPDQLLGFLDRWRDSLEAGR